MSLKTLPKEQFDALLAMSIPDFRKTLGAMMAPMMASRPAPIDIPAKIEDSSFKGPASDIPIRIYTPEGNLIRTLDRETLRYTKSLPSTQALARSQL
jgi:hypothetical protein